MTNQTNEDPAAQFLRARRRWLRVEIADRGGDAWDVVLRIDGTYFGEDGATREDMRRYFDEWLAEALEPATPPAPPVPAVPKRKD